MPSLHGVRLTLGMAMMMMGMLIVIMMMGMLIVMVMMTDDHRINGLSAPVGHDVVHVVVTWVMYW